MFEFERFIKVVFDATFAATRHKNHFGDAGFNSFFDRILNQGFIHDAQHFLRTCFGSWQKAGAKASDRKYGFFDVIHRVLSSFKVFWGL